MNLPILLIVVLANSLLAIFVYANNSKSSTNRIFSLLSIALNGWLVVTYISLLPNLVENSLIWIRLSIFFAAPIGLLLYLFASTIPSSKVQLKRSFFYALVSLTILIMIINISPLAFTRLEIIDGSPNPVPGPGLAPFALSIFFFFISAFVILFKKLRNSTGKLKEQVRFIMAGVLIMLGLIISTIMVPLLLLRNTTFVPLSPLYTLIFLGMTTYAIVRHRLLDIRLVVARAIAYAALVLLIGIFFIGSTVAVTSFFLDTTTTLQQIILYATLTLVVALVFQSLRRWLEVVTDKIFFKADYDSNALLSELTKIMAESVLIDDIAHKLLYKIIFEMRITRGAFVLTDAGRIFVTEYQGYKFKQEPTFSEKDIFSLQALDKDLIFEDLEEGSAKELMRKLNVTVVIPLKTKVDHVGVLLLGEKASGEIYSDKDIKVLEIFAPEAAISFENAKSVEKIRRFNITLREQVDRATKELKEANEQLKSLDKLKDEFLSIASHDLRTPMTAIKSYLWMAVNGRAGELNPQLKRYLDISYNSAERMITMINDLLNVSRIEAGRVQMSFEDADITPIVNQVFAEMAGKASEKQIELKYEPEKDLPHAILDKQRFPEVLQNLVGNALKFTPEKGKITVSAVKSKEPGLIQIAVKDTGVGISKEDQDKLFSKYGRMEHSYSAASTTGGTGLGLYITKNYVELHGGKVWVESELGKGTSFIFTLKLSDKKVLDEMNKEASKKQIGAVIPQVK